MDIDPAPLDLPARLLAVAEEWSQRWSAFRRKDIGISSAAHKVLRDSLFFERTNGGKNGPSTSTLAKFADFFARPVNWPPNEDGICIVPQSAREFAHINGITLRPLLRSPDIACQTIGAGEVPMADDAGAGTIPPMPRASGASGAAGLPPPAVPGVLPLHQPAPGDAP